MYNDPANANKVAIAKQTARDVIKTGANVVRMNFSHGSFEEHGIRIKMAREAAEELGLPISLLCDTKGPELRLLEVDGEPAIEKNSKVTIHCKDFVLGNANEFSVSTKTDTVSDYNMAKDLTVGNLILVDDGKLQLHIDNIDVEKGLVFTTALNNHLIKTKKRLNLPGAQYSLPYMSEHDQKVVKFACDNDFDYIAPSFITCKEDIEEIKKILRENGKEGKIKIISKPENTKAIEKIDEIIKHSDGVMVPRGDLGMEIPFYEVPY
jgi:pyruvate kinase